MNREHLEEQSALYALGLLEGDELVAFERELASDPSLAKQTEEYGSIGVLLAQTIPLTTPPARLRTAIFEQIERQQEIPANVVRPNFSFGWVPWALAACLAIFCGVIWNQRSQMASQLTLSQQENDTLQEQLHAALAENADFHTKTAAFESQRASFQSRITSLETRNPLDEVKTVTLSPQPNAPVDKGLVALWDAKQRAGVLNADALPVPATDKDYQLWIITPQSPQPMSAGLISSSSKGQMKFRAGESVTEVAALAVSLEPKGGSVSPQGPVIYVGKL